MNGPCLLYFDHRRLFFFWVQLLGKVFLLRRRDKGNVKGGNSMTLSFFSPTPSRQLGEMRESESERERDREREREGIN